MVDYVDWGASGEEQGKNLCADSPFEYQLLTGTVREGSQVAADLREPVTGAVKKICFQPGIGAGYIYQIFPREYLR